MQELVGRLTALDPEASETLKVVSYFDVLVAGGVGLQALLRGAAVLSGTVAGAFDGRRTHRIGPDGNRLADDGAPAGGARAGVVPAGGAPAGVAPADVARASVARVDVARAGVARADDAPAEVARTRVARASVARVDVARAGVARADDAPAEVARTRVARAGVAPAGVVPAAVAPGRAAPDGASPHRPEARPHWPTRTISDGHVWLEREGAPHANDEMVIERLALAVDLVGTRGPGPPGSALEIVLDAARDTEERRVALSRLRLDPARETRVAALPLSHDPGAALSTVVATPYGLVRAVLLGRGETVPAPAGVGVVRRGDELPESFRTALLALRLLPGRDAVVDAAELGVVLAAVSALEPVAARQPDVVALARLDARARAVLDELAASESVRAAATALGMHHSTLQARHDALTAELGYDPRSLDGRARFRLASLLLRLAEDR